MQSVNPHTFLTSRNSLEVSYILATSTVVSSYASREGRSASSTVSLYVARAGDAAGAGDSVFPLLLSLHVLLSHTYGSHQSRLAPATVGVPFCTDSGGRCFPLAYACHVLIFPSHVRAVAPAAAGTVGQHVRDIGYEYPQLCLRDLVMKG